MELSRLNLFDIQFIFF